MTHFSLMNVISKINVRWNFCIHCDIFFDEKIVYILNIHYRKSQKMYLVNYKLNVYQEIKVKKDEAKYESLIISLYIIFLYTILRYTCVMCIYEKMYNTTGFFSWHVYVFFLQVSFLKEKNPLYILRHEWYEGAMACEIHKTCSRKKKKIYGVTINT